MNSEIKVSVAEHNFSMEHRPDADNRNVSEVAVETLIQRMTLREKIGQLNQINAGPHNAIAQISDDLRNGRIGSIINQVDVNIVNEMQRIAVEESRLGIPLLVGRDVIHGYKTVMPIPLGQAASWNPDIVREGAHWSAKEARKQGVNWTFAPMIDVSRDARWGRIAESFGEDPLLNSVMGVAMVEGFQGSDMSSKDSIAATAKHFAGYGASEGGRDYSTTNIPENELRNIYLRPFKAAAEAGVATFMVSFGDIDGVPATANSFLMQDVLRGEWDYQGFVVSDWDSIRQLTAHGLTENDKDAACAAAIAGVDMDMESRTFLYNLEALVNEDRVSEQSLDAKVANVLKLKFELGLFDNPYVNPDDFPEFGSDEALQTAKQAAVQSLVLLKNDNDILPLSPDALSKLSIIGPLADAAEDQLGTWIFDGDPNLSVSSLQAIKHLAEGQFDLHYDRAMPSTRSRDSSAFEGISEAAKGSDAVLLFLGEEAILSGEAHSRADINLPGAQADLVKAIRQTGKPVIAVIQAGRPLTLSNIIDEVDAILYAWHPGTMGGAAIADVLFGRKAPSGKLPVAFPKMVGQIPIHYNHKNTGRPATPDEIIHIDDIEIGAPQTSLGMTSFHLDAGYRPLFPFGFGLSYTQFSYSDLSMTSDKVRVGDTVSVSVTVKNEGDVAGTEVVQLYMRDIAASVTRPVRELKGFQRVHLEPGEAQIISFVIGEDEMAFYRRDMTLGVEPGRFHIWVGGSSEADLHAEFELTQE